jgi:hypothetical protein
MIHSRVMRKQLDEVCRLRIRASKTRLCVMRNVMLSGAA